MAHSIRTILSPRGWAAVLVVAVIIGGVMTLIPLNTRDYMGLLTKEEPDSGEKSTPVTPTKEPLPRTYQSMLNKEFTPPPALVFTVQVQSGCDLNSPETCNLQILKAAPYQDRFVPRHPVFSPTHTLTVQVGDQSFPAELSVADIVIIEGFGKDHEGAGIEKSLKQTPFNVYIEFPKGTIIQGDTVTLPGGEPVAFTYVIEAQKGSVSPELKS